MDWRQSVGPLGKSPTVINLENELRYIEKAAQQKQFEQRCWELFVQNWDYPENPDTVEYILNDIVRDVKHFEAKMKELQASDTEAKNIAEEADFHERMRRR